MGSAAAAKWETFKPVALHCGSAETVQCGQNQCNIRPARCNPCHSRKNETLKGVHPNSREGRHTQRYNQPRIIVCASASFRNLKRHPSFVSSSPDHCNLQAGFCLDAQRRCLIRRRPSKSPCALAASHAESSTFSDSSKDADSPGMPTNANLTKPRESVEPDALRPSLSRSGLVRGVVFGVGACMLGQETQLAEAVGLISFPPAKLTNNYFLVRAGESEVESQGLIMTNPVAKTSMDSGLSKIGRQQVLSTIRQLDDLGACTANCWIWPSITQRAYQTAELLASAFTIGRSRIVPEYSFLDARGLGSYEGRPLAQIQEVYEADKSSPFWRPPPFVDGTPNESVEDVLVRVRQLMSILETQYQGEQVIIVSPDSDNLSVLQAALLGADLRQHSGFSFRPGEARKVVLNAEAPPAPTSGFFKCKQRPNRQWDCAI